MKRLIATALIAACLTPIPAGAYDAAPDQNMLRALGERIDGDVNQGVLSTDRAALLRAELDATQKLITNGDSQATAMLGDIDRDLAAVDNTVNSNEVGRDLFYHVGDTITIAMRDEIAWQASVQNTDIIDIKNKATMNATGVQGAYLAKAPGYTAVTLTDASSGKHVRFRFYIVDKAIAG